MLRLRHPALPCALLLALTGCAVPDVAEVELHVAADGLDLAGVVSVRLTLSPGDGPAFAPLTLRASPALGGWSVSVPSVPSGPGRLVTVEALDQAGIALFSGSARVDVVPGETLRLLVLLQAADAPPPAPASPPRITSLAVWNPRVAPGDPAYMAATAEGSGGEPVAFAWSAPAGCGAFDTPTLASTRWSSAGVAPGTVCALRFSASSASGGSSAVTVPVAVSLPP